MKTIFNKLKNGSILAYTLIIMTIMLMAALSVASVVVLEKKSASNTAESTQAFAVADSGLEKVLSYHSRHSSEPLSALGTCNEDGTVTFNIADGTVKVTLYADTEATQLLDCNDSNNKLSQIRKVKALGSYAGTTRVLEVAVAAGSCTNGMELLAESNNRTITSAQFDNIVNAVKNDRKSIKYAICKNSDSSKIMAINNVGFFRNGNTLKIIGLSSSQGNAHIACTFNGDCRSATSYTDDSFSCDGGWAVYAGCECGC